MMDNWWMDKGWWRRAGCQRKRNPSRAPSNFLGMKKSKENILHSVSLVHSFAHSLPSNHSIHWYQLAHSLNHFISATWKEDTVKQLHLGKGSYESKLPEVFIVQSLPIQRQFGFLSKEACGAIRKDSGNLWIFSMQDFFTKKQWLHIST